MADAPPLIDDGMVEFLRGPVAIMLGTTDVTGVADAVRASAVVVIDRRRLRVLIPAWARTALANATVGARAAVLATDITDYRSLQWKGRVVAVGEERTPGDLAVVHRQVDLICEIAPSIGLQSELARRVFALDVLPVVVEVDAVFDQTPGKSAGRCIGGEP